MVEYICKFSSVSTLEAGTLTIMVWWMPCDQEKMLVVWMYGEKVAVICLVLSPMSHNF